VGQNDDVPKKNQKKKKKNKKPETKGTQDAQHAINEGSEMRNWAMVRPGTPRGKWLVGGRVELQRQRKKKESGQAEWLSREGTTRQLTGWRAPLVAGPTVCYLA
jgi:antibiotic biosynthesis monooxygenase (ABM) superfamily enzyme